MRLPLHFLLLAVFVACAGPQANGSKAAVEFFTDDAHVLSVAMENAEFAFPYELLNSSQGPATLVKVDYTLTLAGESPHQTSVPLNMAVPAGQTLANVLKVQAPLSASEHVFATREASGPTRYNQVATFTVATANGTTDYQAEWNGELFLPRRPSVTTTAQAVRYEGNFELHFAMGIKNPNAFALPVESLDYVITIDGVEIQKGTVAQHQKLQPASELIFDITRAVGRDDLVELAKKLMPQKSIVYQIEATLTSAGQTHIVPLSGTIDFIK